MNTRTKLLPFAVAGASFFATLSQAHANLTIFDKDDWKFSVGGFIEADGIFDSTRSLRETIGNAPVDSNTTNPGNASNGRTQFSIRNSRFDFTVEAPETSGWHSKAYFEFDFLGQDPSPGTAGNSEASYYDNPTLRVRHAYLQAGKDGFQVLAGQYWDLLGWQPYYFITTTDVSPLPGMIYYRTAQLRGLKEIAFSDDDVLQAAVSIARPAEEDSRYPSLEAGLRMAFGERKSGLTGAASGARVTQPMSVAVSAGVTDYSMPNPTNGGAAQSNATTNQTHFPGSMIVADAMLPVIASPDGKDVANTLSLLGEYSTGVGFGEEFTNWTGNVANPLSTATVGGATNFKYLPNLDAGLGDYDPNGNFYLIHLQSFNIHAQYHLPEGWDSFIDAGYGQLYSNNADNITSKTKATVIPYNREQMVFANFFHDFTTQLRAAIELNRVTTSYQDGSMGGNNRVELSAYFIF
jgi:hypothetical protein